ncbi:protein kinase [Microbacteriaceae bacterium VKM Ac-2855]|nr:protein kinase [Microbacteriaceae bacterium VKM Ac-2855]
MSGRQRVAPPEIPGLTFLDHLGSGGFAEVFTYEQTLTKRVVAVKVLTATEADLIARFKAEAQMMAQFSWHQNMATIFDANIAPNGRGYIVMEYYRNQHLGKRFRVSPMSVESVLQIGIKLAGAVETLHRAGLVHRDIKPENVLLDEEDEPHLSDFGISATTSQARAGEVSGLSVIWSPPEVLESAAVEGNAADIYSLGATIYGLLAGRDPFHVPGGANDEDSKMLRIIESPLQPIGRSEVPASLARLLATALAKRPEDRFTTAYEFALAMQRVQHELHFPRTEPRVRRRADPQPPIDESGTSSSPTRPNLHSSPENVTPLPVTSTPVTSTPVTSTPVTSTPSTPAPSTPDVGRPTPLLDTERAAPRVVSLGDGGGSNAGTVIGPAPRPQPDLAEPVVPRRPSARIAVIAVLALALIGGSIAVGAAVLSSSGTVSSAGETVAPDAPADPLVDGIAPLVTDLTGSVAEGTATFTWTNPQPAVGDYYLWSIDRAGQDPVFNSVDDTSLTIPAEPAGATCIEVVLVRSDGTSADDSTKGCAP